MTDKKEPWWATNKELQEFFRTSFEEFEREGRELERNRKPIRGPDPVLTEFYTGACRRGLAKARDDLADARQAYDESVRAARDAGYSWGGIARILGVSKQLLHRRFR